MNYVHEQIAKTLEHLLQLRSQSNNRFVPSPKQSRICYRINHEKLEKYRRRNQSPSTKEVIHRKTISTQTTLNDELTSSTDTSSTVSKSNEHKNDSLGISESDLSIDLSSLINTSENLITEDSNASTSELSISDTTPPCHFHASKSIYIPSIVRHMFGGDPSDGEQE